MSTHPWPWAWDPRPHRWRGNVFGPVSPEYAAELDAADKPPTVQRLVTAEAKRAERKRRLLNPWRGSGA